MSEAELTSAIKRRRWLRFSLRTVLIATALLCIWLAVISTRARKQARAIARMQVLGWQVTYNYQYDEDGKPIRNAASPAPAWLGTALGEEYFRRVAMIYTGSQYLASNDDLAVLKDIPGMQRLELYDQKRITDAGLSHLSGLTDFKYLAIRRTSVTGPGLRHIGSLKNLGLLSIENTPLTDEGLEHLRYLKNLKALYLGDTKITDEGLRRLTHLSQLSSLEDLRLAHMNVTDKGLKHLHTLTRLKQLTLVNTKATKEGAAALRVALPNCDVYHMATD